MHKVSGIGGFFFRAIDPDALDLWYFENLGIDRVPMSEGAKSWRQEAGETAFTSMEGAVDQFGLPEATWAIRSSFGSLPATKRAYRCDVR